MQRNRTALLCGLLLVAVGCSEGDRAAPEGVDCSVMDDYEFRNITDFSGNVVEWYLYGDGTPGGVPAPDAAADTLVGQLDEPGRCGDTRFLRLEAYGNDFWGSGFADWAHNGAGSRADGTGYDGISFWLRREPNTDASFFFYVDEGRTVVLNRENDDGSLTAAAGDDQDLDEDGLLDSGDIAGGTECRLPAPPTLGEPNCYNGGIDAPGSAAYVPAADECGNAFHTVVTATTEWQLVLIPWRDLVQWPCPNLLEDGLNVADIAKLEVKFDQGTHYDVWIDNFAFYRRR